jgi:hypothetical protein
LAAAGDDQPAPVTHDEPPHEPADQHGYVLRGLHGLASAVPRAGSMAGHLGAATVTGALLVTGLEGKNIGGHFPFSLSHFLILSWPFLVALSLSLSLSVCLSVCLSVSFSVCLSASAGELEPSAHPLLCANLEKIMAGEEKWFNEQAAGVTGTILKTYGSRFTLILAY